MARLIFWRNINTKQTHMLKYLMEGLLYGIIKIIDLSQGVLYWSLFIFLFSWERFVQVIHFSPVLTWHILHSHSSSVASHLGSLKPCPLKNHCLWNVSVWYLQLSPVKVAWHDWLLTVKMFDHLHTSTCDWSGTWIYNIKTIYEVEILLNNLLGDW